MVDFSCVAHVFVVLYREGVYWGPHSNDLEANQAL